MSPMKRIRGPMHRYGEPDFDRGYLRWGFHDAETQTKEAESILRIVGGRKALRILDLACGTGRHAVHWAKNGHAVTAVDLSETFVAEGKELMRKEGIVVDFCVSDVCTLPYGEVFDLVTWIENSFFDERIVRRVHDYLIREGLFILDVRNPQHPKAAFTQGDWRTWREQDGVFRLERHETDERTGIHEDVWITIDPERDVIEEKVNTDEHPLTLDQKVRIMKAAGFNRVELRTMQGEPFTGGADPYWLWLVARK